jgi:hypothetical protein
VKKLSVVVKDTGRRFQPPSSILPTGPRRHASLLDRIESEGLPSPSGSKDRHSSKRRSGGRDDRDVDKHDRRHGTNSGPRYKGGYSRWPVYRRHVT